MAQPVVLAERDIEYVHTQVIIQTFADRVLVIVTQLQKVGTLIQASVPSTAALAEIASDNLTSDATSSTLPPVHPSIDLNYLFGNAPTLDHQTLYSSYAAQIATLVWASERYGRVGPSHIPVVVGVALKSPRTFEIPSGTESDRATFLQVMELVRDTLGTAHAT
ncbi:hypothetical protein F5148DRAFT_1012056 [Russula earlei]|uniref:Uncharacterized protein n=1 Tax=Russula earlei TaxID=71964 RepID=A0ACC0UDI7_9AGAM|nr:hypothetical protein F5148DRAFT_1012056 [Russula earlei]